METYHYIVYLTRENYDRDKVMVWWKFRKDSKYSVIIFLVNKFPNSSPRKPGTMRRISTNSAIFFPVKVIIGRNKICHNIPDKHVFFISLIRHHSTSLVSRLVQLEFSTYEFPIKKMRNLIDWSLSLWLFDICTHY